MAKLEDATGYVNNGSSASNYVSSAKMTNILNCQVRVRRTTTNTINANVKVKIKWEINGKTVGKMTDQVSFLLGELNYPGHM